MWRISNEDDSGAGFREHEERIPRFPLPLRHTDQPGRIAGGWIAGGTRQDDQIGVQLPHLCDGNISPKVTDLVFLWISPAVALDAHG